MGETTGISWTDHTFNPWEGCQRVSPGCENCYAEARNARFHPEFVGLPEMQRRTGKGLHWGPPSTTPRLLRSAKYWSEPYRWDRDAKKAGKRARVFCASLADVFEDHPEVVPARIQLFKLIEETPNLDWQLLTKRPENMGRLAPASWSTRWPDNVWAGTTAENAEMLARRAPYLRQIPARVRFLSCEPLLEPLEDLVIHIGSSERVRLPKVLGDGIHWVIVGGESGPRARRFMLDWAARIVADCADLGVALWVKQMGDAPHAGYDGPDAGDDPDDHIRPVKFKAHHGADPREWPGHLQVQQFPKEGL